MCQVAATWKDLRAPVELFLVGKISPTERLVTGCGLGKNDTSGSLSFSLNKHRCDRDKAKGTDLTELRITEHGQGR